MFLSNDSKLGSSLNSEDDFIVKIKDDRTVINKSDSNEVCALLYNIKFGI